MPVTHRTIATNGVQLHVAEEGEGPLVVLAHGFPELWYSWRHQIPALAADGFHVVAPDLRGFGDSSRPEEVEAYGILDHCADLTGLLDALGADQAVFVGHDWGAAIVWQLAVADPARVRAVAGLSVPFVPRAPAPPIPIMRRHLGEDFYIVWFQEPGVADAALARDVRRSLATPLVWNAEWAASDEEVRVPRFMSEEDLEVFVRAYERTGFTGGLNLYRNMDRSWERTAHLADRHVEQPALFVTGSRDPVTRFMPASAMEGWVDDLRGSVVIEGGGHWIQQDRPDEVTAALLAFLRDL